MHWLVDECVDAGLVLSLRAAGHDVLYIAEAAPSATDTQILRRTNDDDRLLLTEDKDFGDLVYRRRLAVPGVVLLRIEPQDRMLKWPRLETAIARYGDKLFGRFLVIDEARFRSRSLPIT